MKAIILAAGFSTRLYPLTKDFPKGLLQLGEKKLIQHVLDTVLELPEIDEFAMVTNAVAFPHYLEFVNQPEYQEILLLNNSVEDLDKRLGAIKDLWFVIEQLGWQSEDILVLPSDTVVSLKWSEFLAFATEKKAFTNVLYDTHDKDVIRGALGCAQLDGDRIASFVEKPDVPNSTITSAPIYYYPSNTLQLIKAYIKTGQNTDSPGAIIPWLLTQTECYGYVIQDGYYHDVGTHEVYQKRQTAKL
jgi:glucose-1-phosphate thymidylyltransferase